MSAELDPKRVEEAKARARYHAKTAADLGSRASAESAKVRLLQRTWGFDICPAGHGEQCCGAHELCAAAPSERPW